jgi:hypothetical protein
MVVVSFTHSKPTKKQHQRPKGENPKEHESFISKTSCVTPKETRASDGIIVDDRFNAISAGRQLRYSIRVWPVKKSQ